MKARLAAAHCAAMIAASFTAAGSVRQEATAQKEPEAPIVRQLTKAERLKKIQVLPGIAHGVIPKSIFDTFALTVNQPMIKGKAALSLSNFEYARPRYAYDGYAKSMLPEVGQNPPQNYKHPSITLEFMVSQPNKTHVATFNLYSMVEEKHYQQMEFFVDGKSVQTFKLEHGPAQAMVAFKPTKKGNCRVSLGGEGISRMKVSFFSVDVDVVG